MRRGWVQDQRWWAHTEMKEAPSGSVKTFPARVTEHRLPREMEDSPSLEVLERCLGVILGNWLCLTLPELGDLQRTLPTSNTLCVHELYESHIKISQWISQWFTWKWAGESLSRTIWVAKNGVIFLGRVRCLSSFWHLLLSLTYFLWTELTSISAFVTWFL